MAKGRVRGLMKRVGLEDVPLAHITNLEDLHATIAQMSDGELMHALEREHEAWVSTLSDDELRRELEKVRQEMEQSGQPGE